MLCVPWVRLLVVHVAILELAAPAGSATALQPKIALPPSVKATVPVGDAPATVAVNVTLTPTSDGLPELASAVLAAVWPPIATETVNKPEDPAVALMTLIVTPVVLSTYVCPASSAASSNPPPVPGVMSSISVSSLPLTKSNCGPLTRICAPRLGNEESPLSKPIGCRNSTQ